jgi:hypothetical protein
MEEVDVVDEVMEEVDEVMEEVDEVAGRLKYHKQVLDVSKTNSLRLLRIRLFSFFFVFFNTR